MTHGYQRRRRAWRAKRRIRRGFMKPMEAHQSRYDRLTPRTTWKRKHPRFKRFSFGSHIRGFGRKRGRKL